MIWNIRLTDLLFQFKNKPNMFQNVYANVDVFSRVAARKYASLAATTAMAAKTSLFKERLSFFSNFVAFI